MGVAVACAVLAVLPALASANIYWTNNSGGIGFDTIDGNPGNVNQAFIPAGDTNAPEGVAVDASHIYWANFGNSTIGRANLDGSSPNPSFINTGASTGPSALFITGGFIYWTDYMTGTVSRDTIDGNPANIVTLVMGLTHPGGIAVDGGHLYWSEGDGAGSTIGRANLDGSSPNSSFITGQAGPVGLALAGGFLYWANWSTGTGGGTINRDTVDGNPANIRPLVTGQNQPIAVAVSRSHIYWSNWGAKTIGVSNLDGSGVNANFAPTASTPFQIAIDLPPSEISPPTIAGSAVIGNTLTETNGSWTLSPIAFSHQWLRCNTSGGNCAAIGGATGPTYVVTTADVGSTIRVQEVASNPLGGSSDPVLSAPTGVVPPPPPPPPPTASIAAVTRSGSAQLVTVACNGVSGQQCSGTIVGTVHERKRGKTILAVTARKTKGKPKTKTVTVTVARGSFTAPAGGSVIARIALNATGNRLLARFQRLSVSLTFSGSIATTRTALFTLPRLRVNTPSDNWFHINQPCSDCYTMAQHVPITGLPAKAKIAVLCRGSGCPFGRRSFTPRNRRFDVAPALRNAHLQPGTKVTVVITAPGKTGVAVRYTIQRGAGPLRSLLCLAPGTGSPGPCT